MFSRILLWIVGISLFVAIVGVVFSATAEFTPTARCKKTFGEEYSSFQPAFGADFICVNSNGDKKYNAK